MRHWRAAVVVALVVFCCSSERLSSAQAAGQNRDDVALVGSFERNTYKNQLLGITYSFPEGLQPQSFETLPASDGRTHILLALWDSPRSTPTPRIVMFVTDVSHSPNVTAASFLHSIAKAAESGGAQLSTSPVEENISGLRFLRLDYRQPDQTAQLYNAGAVAIWGKYALVFQLNGATPQKLEEYAQSLKTIETVTTQTVPVQQKPDVFDVLEPSIPVISEIGGDFEVKITHGRGLLVRRKGAEEWLPSYPMSEPLLVGLLDGTQKIYVVTKAMTPPKLKHQQDPQYPEAERTLGTGGKAMLHMVVDNRGVVRLPTVDASTNAKFGDAALESVKKWEYEPAKLNGEPVAVLVVVEMEFKFE